TGFYTLPGTLTPKAPHKAADACDSGIVFRRHLSPVCFRVDVHRPEFDHPKGSVAFTNAFLKVEDGPRRVQLDQDAKDQKCGQEEGRSEDNKRDVDYSLDPLVQWS